MPVGIDRLRHAHVVQALHLLCRELELDAAQVFLQLCGIACADHQRRHRRPVQYPIQRDLRNASAELISDLTQHVDDGIELFEWQLRAMRPERRGPTALWRRLVAADLAAQAAAKKRTPDDCSDS